MHEVSIALNLLDIVTEECRKQGFHSIDSINLRIGRASGIMPEALLFAFETVKAESIAEAAKQNIEEAPVSGKCASCLNAFSVAEDYVLACPLCGGTSFQITGGREMEIIDMEVNQ